MTTQETINKAVAWAVNVANDSAHGYDQANRWGPNYDCSSFVITAWNEAGVPVKASGASYTGNMYFAFLKCGFVDVTNKVNLYTGGGMKKGDVLLNVKSHTEMYIGDGKVVKASINEKGTTTGGQTGDQNGAEIRVGPYYNFPWNYVLRYEGGDVEEPASPSSEKEKTKYHAYTYKVETNLLKRGDYGPQVLNMQILLKAHGFYDGKLDGDFGDKTYEALIAFQKAAGISVDGEWGGESFKAMWNYSSK